MVTATYDIDVDWDNNGVFEPVNAVTTDTLQSLVVVFGRDRLRRLAPPMVSTMGFALENDDNTYHPENTASSLSGNLVPHRRIRLQATFSSTTHTLFQGFLDDFIVDTNPGRRQVAVNALDGLATALDTTISTALYKGIDTGTAIGVVLDLINWPEDDRDLDVGATNMAFWWEEDETAWNALLRLLNSEGPPALLYVSAGTIVFRSRHHRLLNSASTTSQATFRGGGTEPVFSVGFEYDHGWRDIINNVEFLVRLYVQEAKQTVWEFSGETLSLAASEVKTLRATAEDPFVVAVGEDELELPATEKEGS